MTTHINASADHHVSSASHQGAEAAERVRRLIGGNHRCLAPLLIAGIGLGCAAWAEEPPAPTKLTTTVLGSFPSEVERAPRIHGISQIEFRAQIIDDDFPGGAISQTALADFTGDGRLEYHVGSSTGNYIYQYSPEGWTRYQIGVGRAPTDAGGTAADITGDGRADVIAGSAWFRNPGRLDVLWERLTYGDNPRVHDQEVFDITGDGRLDMISMSDATNLRWYRIPENPADPWVRHDVGPAIHGGISPKGFGDINGNGHIDIVRGDIWFENVGGDGIGWRQHPLAPVMTLPPGKLDEPGWANGTRTWVGDVNGNGRNDVVQTDAETRGGRVWWMENLGAGADGSVEWRRHIIAGGLRNRTDGESAYLGRVMGGMHSLFVADFTGNGLPDVVTIEQDWQRARPGPKGDEPPRAYLFENLGVGFDGTVLWHEHVIADVNLGGHEIVGGDVTGNGKIDIIAKPWSPSANNALKGKAYVLFLENVSP